MAAETPTESTLKTEEYDPDDPKPLPTILRDQPEYKRNIRVLITGATGLLGRQLVREFSEYSVTGVGFSRVSEESNGRVVPTLEGGQLMMVRCDMRDASQVEKLFHKIKPHLIIHSAAERRPDVVEGDEEGTRALNVDATAQLASLAVAVKDCFLLLISTDYVFDGTSPPYKPNAEPRPLNRYGQTKLEAEKALWASGHSGGVLRVPILYGRAADLKESAITCLVPQLLAARHSHSPESPLLIDHWALRVPTLVDDVAFVCRQLCERRLRHCSLSGTWHWSGPEIMSKYDMSVHMARFIHVPVEHLAPDTREPTGPTLRPKDSRLDTSVLSMMGIGRKTPFVEGLQRVFADHPDLLKPPSS